MQLDWYPSKLLERIIWHANFAARAADSGTTFGLSAGEVTQIAADAAAVEAVLGAALAAERYVQAFSKFQQLMLDGPATAPLQAIPQPPAALTLGAGSLAGIKARTRRYAARIKSAAGYTKSTGEAYGIVPPETAPPAIPEVTARALTQSQVRLRLTRRGYPLVAVDSRRNGGAWEQIGVSQLREFVDARPPMEENRPELREYRVQGMLRNQRVGGLSDVARAVTVP